MGDGVEVGIASYLTLSLKYLTAIEEETLSRKLNGYAWTSGENSHLKLLRVLAYRYYLKQGYWIKLTRQSFHVNKRGGPKTKSWVTQIFKV